MRTGLALIAAAALLASCASPAWNGNVRQWGSLRQVLRDGDPRAKVGILEATQPQIIGIGAIESLNGEILILDGEAWVASAGPQPGTVVVRAATNEDRAAFLATSQVPRWREIRVDQDMDIEKLDELLRSVPELSRLEAFPFIVRGTLEEFDSHVLNGRCPFNPEDTRGTEPVRVRRERVDGTLAGFFSRQPPGTLVHHGTLTHIHVWLGDPAPFAAHVDRVRIRRESRLFLPSVK